MTDPVYMATVSAPTNIAVIKYWGKANKEFNTPINDSMSVTLDQKDLRAVTTAAASPKFSRDRLWLNGVEESTDTARFRACVDGVKALATDKLAEDGTTVVSKKDWQNWKVHISSYNTFPTAAGLASSAAGYAALVAALAELFGAQEEFPGQLTTVARQGSGSACRSLYGGIVAWRRGSAENDWKNSKAEQICPESHWPELRALICVVSDQQKDTSSTAGMSTSVATSHLLAHRAAAVVPERMNTMIQACRDKDFQTFGQLTMQDSNQFHATCLDTYPPIFYMNDVSRSIIRMITLFNGDGTIRAAYTFDAGPNAVLYVLEENVVELTALILRYYPSFGENYLNDAELLQKAQAFALDPKLVAACDKARPNIQTKDVQKIYYTKAGPGPQVLDEREANLDPETGLNKYVSKKAKTN